MTIAMIFLIVIFFLQNLVLGAILGRMDGGGPPKTPEWLERSLIMAYFVLACMPYAGWFSLLAGVGAFGIATGHGSYFLARTIIATEPERLDFIVRLFFGEDPRSAYKFEHLRGNEHYSLTDTAAIDADMKQYGMTKLYWRGAFGMFVTGTLVGLPGVLLCLYFGAWLPALLLSLTGVVKAAAYVIAYELWESTEPAEYGNGGARTALALAAFLLFFFH